MLSEAMEVAESKDLDLPQYRCKIVQVARSYL